MQTAAPMQAVPCPKRACRHRIMSYTEKDKISHIREIQGYLRGISHANPRIHRIVPSGVYDDATREAVLDFQREYGLPVTGEIDRSTWDAIVVEYKNVRRQYGKGECLYPFFSGGMMIKQGSEGYQVFLLQTMLNAIADNYDNIIKPSINGSFDNATASAVKQIQAASGLPLTGDVDINTWNILAHAFNHNNTSAAG